MEDSTLLAVFLRPFVLLVVTVVILYPIRLVLLKYLPEGKLKRFLLLRID